MKCTSSLTVLDWHNLWFPITQHHPVPFSFLLTAFGINSILYQRGIYPPETFTRVNHYDMSLLITTDCNLKKYLSDVVSQLRGTLVWFRTQICWFQGSTVSAAYVLCVNFSVLWHSEWLNACTVKKLVLVVTCLETNEVLERWQFDIECDKTAKESRSESSSSTVTFIPPQ